ncbi:MAG: 4-(cytidine 5'-diphospho)-2-C-methyl-D-erythritol kinase [Lachnospiraceae bacterium]|nr:4-(cytidine 5'-diphospho)-2-C-methyl-D-erythritol kinase [Lachnospiraceae bacterium]MDY5741395.1 4-(cytidine 5'-diphospho)-2-C-methyl-D-erythritol kinase [Lachnospiraceae bacterium]
MKEKSICLPAYAKVNPILDVIRRREDGYHEIDMVLARIALHDTVTVTVRSDETITCRCSRPGIPTDEKNIAVRAAAMLQAAFGTAGVDIEIEKRIPDSAGLAGGSADAAVVLTAMNELFSLKLSEIELCNWGLRLGADVPFCLCGGCRRARGIGEQLEILPLPQTGWLVLVKPDFGVSTGEAYHSMKPEQMDHPSVEAMVTALRSGDLKAIAAAMANVMENYALVKHPVLAELKTKLVEQGALGSVMSGSGATVFGLFATEEQAAEALSRLAQRYPDWTVILTTWQP